MTQNTETDIHIYNSTCSQLDGISIASNRRTATENRKHAEITLESSTDSEISIIYTLCRPLQALHRRKYHEIGTESAHKKM